MFSFCFAARSKAWNAAKHFSFSVFVFYKSRKSTLSVTFLMPPTPSFFVLVTAFPHIYYQCKVKGSELS